MSTDNYATDRQTAPAGAPTRSGNGFAVAGLVCGIIGLLIPLLALLAVIFGGVGISRANNVGSGRGMAIAGVVLGLIGLIGWIILFAVGGSFNFYVHS